MIDWNTLSEEYLKSLTEPDDFKAHYMGRWDECLRGSGRTSFQINRLRTPALFVCINEKSIGYHPLELEHRKITLISIESLESDWRSNIVSAVDFDVDHAVWEHVSTRWSYYKENRFREAVYTVAWIIEERTGEKPSLVQGFKGFNDEKQYET